MLLNSRFTLPVLLLTLFLTLGLTTSACQAASQQTKNRTTVSQKASSTEKSIKGTANSKTSKKSVKKEKKAVHVTIETEKGTMKALLYTEDAPITTQNFIELAKSGFYDGLVFHRVEPNFVIQTGDPSGTGSGGSQKTIPLEINPKLRHEAGALGMARTNDPNSASSQWYVSLAPTHFLDDNYAVFGKLESGLDVAQKIERGDKMTKVTIEE